MILNEGKETSLKCNECVFVASCQIHLINHIRHVHNRENGYGKEDDTWKEASNPITKTEESKLKDEESKEEEMKVDEAVDTYCEDLDLEFEAVQRSYAKSN